MNRDKVIEVIEKIASKIEENKLFLTELDNPIGDSDHGINLARGFSEVIKKLDTLKDKDIATILKTTGMTLVSTVGGASGPLYGTAFMYAGNVVTGKEEIDINDFVKMLEAAIDGIQKRGKAVKGEKTMLDAMMPSLDAIKENISDTKIAFAKGVEAAKEGVEYTKTIVATKGRASYVGERSIGHQDPGATSYTILLETISENV